MQAQKAAEEGEEGLLCEQLQAEGLDAQAWVPPPEARWSAFVVEKGTMGRVRGTGGEERRKRELRY